MTVDARTSRLRRAARLALLCALSSSLASCVTYTMWFGFLEVDPGAAADVESVDDSRSLDAEPVGAADGGSGWLKVALTPCTLAADVVVTPILGFGGAIGLVATAVVAADGAIDDYTP